MVVSRGDLSVSDRQIDERDKVVKTDKILLADDGPQAAYEAENVYEQHQDSRN